jgi:hypothetical protein
VRTAAGKTFGYLGRALRRLTPGRVHCALRQQHRLLLLRLKHQLLLCVYAGRHRGGRALLRLLPLHLLPLLLLPLLLLQLLHLLLLLLLELLPLLLLLKVGHGHGLQVLLLLLVHLGGRRKLGTGWRVARIDLLRLTAVRHCHRGCRCRRRDCRRRRCRPGG